MTTPPPVLASLFPEAGFLAPVGAGAYGQVWLARFPGEVFLAVKFVPDSPVAARERRAIRLLHSLADPARDGAPLHPALMPILDVREAPAGAPSPAFAYAMPLADALRPNWRADPSLYRPRSLATDLVARRALPLADCLAVAEALGSALDFLQRNCLVHRDIKPANVLWLGGAPVLADFGLLADTREAVSVVGTPGYVPAEQHGRFSADLYSLGVLLSELATGRPPAERGFTPVPEADTADPRYPAFLALLRRATDPSPGRRPQTAAAFLAELREAANPPPRRRCARRLWLAVPLFLLAAAAVAFLATRFSSPPPREPPAATPPQPAPETHALPEPPVVAPLPDIPETPAAPETPEVPETPDVPALPAMPEPPKTQVPPAIQEPPASPSFPPAPATNNPLLYISAPILDTKEFLQLYTDRIRVGLPRSLDDPAHAALVLCYDEAAVSPAVRVCPLEAPTPANVPPTFATDPVFPRDAFAARRGRTAIAMLPVADPYPEAVFLFPDPPDVVADALDALSTLDFAAVENLWERSYDVPAMMDFVDGTDFDDFGDFD